MKIELVFGLLFLLLLLASLGVWSLFFDKPSEYEWKKHMAAKQAWKKLLEDK